MFHWGIYVKSSKEALISSANNHCVVLRVQNCQTRLRLLHSRPFRTLKHSEHQTPHGSRRVGFLYFFGIPVAIQSRWPVPLQGPTKFTVN
jgi:hypothetical protein